jgi:hypothetical protein
MAGVNATRTVTGTVELRRIGFRRFPVNELTHDGAPIAELGHVGWLRIYLGRGVRVELDDGTRWRIRSTTSGGLVSPVVADERRRKVAMGTGRDGVYAVNVRDFAYSLNPGHRPRRADAVWTLREHDTDVAAVGRKPLRCEAYEPVHLGAVLVSFVLVRYGVPDDYRATMPQFRWG